MRIGKFSKKHNITRDTVRHYIDIGLLIPKKEGHHFKFDNTHSKDIDKIIKLKKLDFSLMEIQKVLNFNRIAGENSKEYTNYYLNALEVKKYQILEYQKKYEEIEINLNKKIEDLLLDEDRIKKTLGINVESLEIFYCPKCRNNLNISDGNIENNMIIKGKLSCSCGYAAYIKNGIYIGNKIENKKQIPSKLDFLEDSSTGFINLYYDGMSELIEEIESNLKNQKYILELENCSGTFLMQYMENLKEETTYILINNDKTRLKKIKNNLELNSKHDKFIFICEEYDYLPIKNNSIDLIVDHWMTKNYAADNNMFLLDDLYKFLKSFGLLVGIYPYLTNKDTDIYIKKSRTKGYFKPEYITSKFNKLGIKEKSIKKIGPIIEESSYNDDIKDRKLYLNIYSGSKKGISIIGG